MRGFLLKTVPQAIFGFKFPEWYTQFPFGRGVCRENFFWDEFVVAQGSILDRVVQCYLDEAPELSDPRAPEEKNQKIAWHFAAGEYPRLGGRTWTGHLSGDGLPEIDPGVFL